jgi:hypothetical protein
VTLTDGASSLSREISAQATNIVTVWPNIMPATTINWQAETLGPVLYNGQTYTGAGTATSGPSGQVSINLALTPVDDVAVNCVSSVNTPLPCTVTADASVLGGPDVTETATFDAAGDTLTLPTATTLVEWQADSDGAIAQNGQFIVFSGTATTALLPAVTLVLDVENVQGPAAQTLQVRCINSLGASAANCDITVEREAGLAVILIEELNGVAEGAYQTLNLPDGPGEGDLLIFSAAGDDGSQGGQTATYNSVIDGQQINIELN